MMSRLMLAMLLGAFAAGATMLLPRGMSGTLSPHALGQVMAPELEPNLGWLNTDRPLRFDGDLRGHVVLLDFWTYCCINCLHVMPDLEYLEEKYKDEPFVVIGVHSAKFEAEGDRESIRQAMFRYDVKHPVVIDAAMGIWRQYGIRGWPGFALIGTDGEVIGIAGGEGQRDLLDAAIARALEDGRRRGDAAVARVQYDLDAMVAPATGLTFPGKVLADKRANGGEGFVFIADSSADRIVVTTYPDEMGRSELVRIVGTGERGLVDGAAEDARLHDPQGMAFDAKSDTLYIADTKNHAIRALDLSTWELSTIAGTGEQAYDRRGGKAGTEQGLSSPWDVELSPDAQTLYIAMAGPHQIWSMDMGTGIVSALAGSGYENSLDGPLEDAALAQPSGLALTDDGDRLYFADSESSSVRVVDLAAGEVRTVVGHSVPDLSVNGLFEFGDVDGAFPAARLQHVLGVTVIPGTPGNDTPGDTLLVADTYNSKIKRVDAGRRSVSTISASEQAGYDEPAGLHHDPSTGITFVADTNNHRIVLFDHETGESREMTVSGLRPSGQPEVSADGAIVGTLTVPADGGFDFDVGAELPEGAKLNAEFPATVRVARLSDGGVIAQRTARDVRLPMRLEVPEGAAAAGDELLVELSFAWCREGDDGTCVPANLAWALTLVEAGGGDAPVALVSAPVK
ncbi:MAG: thioredoxin-like domain-containing protein [Planctomycetota bacterium]